MNQQKSNSLTIQRELDTIGGRRIGTNAETGDGFCVLWELNDGRKVIETNGDPIWEGADGFEALASECL